MKILVVTQYFWPEGFRINDLVTGLVDRGHEVTVLTGKPNYPSGKIFPEYLKDPSAFASYNGIPVVRVPMLARGARAITLLLNFVSFALSGSLFGAFKLRGRKFDAIFVFEPSPISVGFPAIVLRWLKKAPVAFWVLDLWPESLEATGVVRSKFVLRQVGKIVKFIYGRCDLILAQSRRFIPEIGRFTQSPHKIAYFPSWADKVERKVEEKPAPEISADRKKFSIVFTGNIGEAQDFGAVLDAAEWLRHNKAVRWIIVGDGRMASWVREEVERRQLQDSFLLPGRFPLERMRSFYMHADALLVSLKAEPIFAMTIPGKLQSYLAEGLPILAMLNGEGADILSRARAGLASPAGNGAALAESVLKMMSMSSHDRSQMGRNGRELSASEFDRDMRIDELSTLLKRLRLS
ncbi:glycosyltransferase family 4 protein [Rhizobium ruizarguesonis]|uniref:glycosyltransferase family 4 protein n=1 Tax=Rhizobium ruizarguesonis TaxID=2081791 RepID=UPI00103021EC|nr:glycosyltransferase family 4 protein [Rhizobium ruizarguesonis]TAV14335.1 glycosyltransferase WbuB [Rhizobium ruizarguesonis]TAV26965.1 glycosyltransferase WbuB [Rhizobium ruizarguesonis]TAW70938.1 glycosyltransferase WbuB [Rhizobium ruizarguesonis]TAW92279.1 glycosyltransferase WbuB [Rhizobium ruizarguesonis]TAY45561.1 glycosyltransferase WbuB [Rhizobium ruizarguesonis]